MVVSECKDVTAGIGICAGFLALLLLMLVILWRKLVRIENRLNHWPPQKLTRIKSLTAAAELDSSQTSHFEEFLDEDPSRKELSKGEQSSAFRKWRQERGMNWSKS
jgi:hypothetical protein